MPSSRRAFLATASLAAAGIAGCADRVPSSSTPTADGETATLGESISVDDAEITVAEFAVVHSYQYLSAPDAFGVESAGDGWFAFVGVTAQGSSPPARDAFTLDVADERIAPADAAFGPVRDLAPVGDGAYTAAETRGYLHFAVPHSPAVDTAAVTLDDARWSIPASTFDPLRATPPAFAVTYDVPDAVGHDDPVPIRLDVTNTGGAGVCRGAINHHGPMHGGDAFSLSLAAGASTTHETTVDYHVGENIGDRLQFAVVVPGESRSFEVSLDGDGTAMPSRPSRYSR
ncbi:hypothetical protein [Haloplanus halobius]|uniref:hypothetical protein n=1 Tax=Haloplanus halobius TaxID=2934938 RepID=UPI00200EAEC5|nr:hypothetical protein [Haloplanus sp. XH21]